MGVRAEPSKFFYDFKNHWRKPVKLTFNSVGRNFFSEGSQGGRLGQRFGKWCGEKRKTYILMKNVAKLLIFFIFRTDSPFYRNQMENRKFDIKLGFGSWAAENFLRFSKIICENLLKNIFLITSFSREIFLKFKGKDQLSEWPCWDFGNFVRI